MGADGRAQQSSAERVRRAAAPTNTPPPIKTTQTYTHTKASQEAAAGGRARRAQAGQQGAVHGGRIAARSRLARKEEAAADRARQHVVRRAARAAQADAAV